MAKLHCSYYKRDKGAYPFFAQIGGSYGVSASGTFKTVVGVKNWAKAIARAHKTTVTFEKIK